MSWFGGIFDDSGLNEHGDEIFFGAASTDHPGQFPNSVLLFNESSPCEGSSSLDGVTVDPGIRCNLSSAAVGDELDPLAGGGNYWALVLLFFPLLTVFGNVLVVMSVYRERSLQSVTNYFIVSLAVADIMVAILVMPLAVYVEVSIT